VHNVIPKLPTLIRQTPFSPVIDALSKQRSKQYLPRVQSRQALEPKVKGFAMPADVGLGAAFVAKWMRLGEK
jgi:hypothetical protein